jgi:GTP 3',8-cyclase
MTNQQTVPRFPFQKIQDQHGRSFNYLRLAINERCNLRCIYCMSEDRVFPPNHTLLQPDEIKRIIDLVANMGVNKIRFTGGEPLLHPNIVDYVQHASRNPNIKSVHLTSNGSLLHQKIESLVQAGLNGINVSIDSFNEDTFFAITRRKNQLSKIKTGIQKALQYPISIKLNVVVMRNLNHQEILDFVAYTKNHRVTVRFIELMPFDEKQIWKTGRFFQSNRIMEYIAPKYPNIEPLQGSATEHIRFKIPLHKGDVAIIPAYSRNICGSCNRFRITADGKIRNCLYAKTEHDILTLMRSGSNDEDIANVIYSSLFQKLIDGWSAQKEAHSPHKKRTSMSQIGG